MDWHIEYAVIDNETDIELVVRPVPTPDGILWHWSMIDVQDEGDLIAVSTVPGFATPELAKSAVESVYNDQWLPHFKDTGERELPSDPLPPIKYRYYVDFSAGGTEKTHEFEFDMGIPEHRAMTINDLLSYFQTHLQQIYNLPDVTVIQWGHASTRQNRLSTGKIDDLRLMVTGEDFTHDGA